MIVPDDQLSLAIGREGQNARLAARLTGWRIDIRSETEFAAEEAEHGYEEEEAAGPLRRDPLQRPPLPERGAARLALLRDRGPPGARQQGHRSGDEVAALSARARRVGRGRGRAGRGRGAERRRRRGRRCGRRPRPRWPSSRLPPARTSRARTRPHRRRTPTALHRLRPGGAEAVAAALGRRRRESRRRSSRPPTGARRLHLPHACARAGRAPRRLRPRVPARGDRAAQRRERTLGRQMSTKRVNDIAKEQGTTVKDLLLKLQAAGIDAAAPSATVDEARALRALGRNGAGAEAAATARADGDGGPRQASHARLAAGRARPRQRRRAPPRRDRLAGLAPRTGRRRTRPTGSNQPPRRQRRGRRRRGVYDEEAESRPLADAPLAEPRARSGSTPARPSRTSPSTSTSRSPRSSRS